jgi:nickel-dependent lactate racemase
MYFGTLPIMVFSLPYGTRTLSLALPDSISVQLVRPLHTDALDDVEDCLNRALNHPHSSVPFDEYLRLGIPITIIVPDKTRQSGCIALLPLVLRRIHERGIPPESIRILFANGTHGPQSEQEKRTIIGDAVYESYSVYDHNPHEEKGLTYTGRTARGTEIRINTIAAESPVIIAIGAIIHHYFAGFGGGPKLIVPGIAAYSTALQNHRLTLTENGDFNSACKDGNIDGNPVYEDIVEAVRLCPPVFFIGTLLDTEGNITDIVAGDPVDAHRSGARLADRQLRVAIRQKTDTVITSGGGYPRDCTMIQAHKALHHAYEAVFDGGVILCCAECRDGIGSPTFMRWFENTSITSMQHELLEHYTLNGHTALALQKKLTTIKIVFVSMLDPTLVRKMGMVPASSLDEGLTFALKGKTVSSVTVIENGAACLPTVGYPTELEN